VLQFGGRTLLTRLTFALNRRMAPADEAISIHGSPGQAWQLAISQILISTDVKPHPRRSSRNIRYPSAVRRENRLAQHGPSPGVAGMKGQVLGKQINDFYRSAEGPAVPGKAGVGLLRRRSERSPQGKATIRTPVVAQRRDIRLLCAQLLRGFLLGDVLRSMESLKNPLLSPANMESSPMLSERMIAVLSALPYRPDAEWGVNILPFGSVYWNDEMPEMRDMLDIKDMGTVLHMFGIRLQLWDNKALSAADRQLWDAVQRQVPDWALFKRMNLSQEQRAVREKAEQEVQQEFDSLGADDDESQGSLP